MIAQNYLENINEDAWISSTASTMLKEGFVILPSFLEAGFFTELSAYAWKRAQSQRGDEGMMGDKRGGTLGHELARSPEFMRLFSELYRARCKAEGRACESLSVDNQVVGYPYKDARDGKMTKATDYHYDGAYVNATLAILMPPRGGELIVFPNLRTGKNMLIIKIFSRFLRHIPFLRRVVPHKIAKTVPNDLCLFFGDRTFHGVEPITVGERLIMTINNHW